MKTSILVCMVLLLSTSGHAECPTADLSGDCFVGLADLAVMASQWEGEPNMPLLYDMASQWMTEGVPVDPENLVWVYIDDPGVPGDGAPDHEGFTGEMSKYETTNAQYCQFLNAALASRDIRVSGNRVYGNSGEYNNQVYFDTWAYTSHSQIIYSEGVFSVCSRDGYSMLDHPVVEVSWYGATAFCEYYGYRLPTQWEWQAVADYDGTFTYGCGTTINQSKANYWDNNSANPLGLSSYPYTSPVNHYSSYGYGMNDMAGNAWEWTSSMYSARYRVIRGGSWYNDDDDCTVSYGYFVYPYLPNMIIGFRVCR